MSKTPIDIARDNLDDARRSIAKAIDAVRELNGAIDEVVAEHDRLRTAMNRLLERSSEPAEEEPA